MFVYIYEDSYQYNSERPAIEKEVSRVEVFDDRIEGYDYEGYKHVWNNFFALTYQNEYLYDLRKTEVYLYETAKAYNKGRPEVVVEVVDIQINNKFITLRNDYTHIINANRILAAVYNEQQHLRKGNI
ncbi:hypothetical protein [Clostridium cellulovorans]|uniref:Uncharacterized protein n=1 Tax=Clostridium cellulovorans (strain ATCC 35296 / DSM 3052 / OCM 3 / 743B) TaxID=573061 RepID=D9SV79_CLOC7|nr:hypothetical protein [Clostridium cellulovorans]ADL53053.1 hypothetical protein Clocel_3374 [Clostridium cellulovorans 743B]